MGFHTLRLRPGSVLGLAAVLLLAAAGAAFLRTEAPPVLPAWSLFQRGEEGATPEERLAFLRQNGWQADPEPLTVHKVTVPEVTDPVFERYACLQEEQGFNLVPFAGREAEEYTYRILNCPGCGEAAAHLLIYKGRIIAADISSLEQGVFMEGVRRPR